MSLALWIMASGKHNVGYRISPTEYDFARKLLAVEQRKARLGIPLSYETRQRISNSKIGKPRSKETRQKMSEANKGKTISQETREKMSKAGKGKPKSDAMRQNLSESKTGKPRPTVTCPHCGKVGGAGSMHQWHFENCKRRL